MAETLKCFDRIVVPPYRDPEHTIPSYTPDEWFDLYQYLDTTTSGGKAMVLSLLIRNNNESGADSSIEIEVDLCDQDDNVLYHITKCLLSSFDEFSINRYTHFVILKPGDKLKVKYEKENISTYLGVIKGI